MQETIQKDSLIGKRITKLDAPEKAGGKTRYIQDLDVQGQLYGKILRSTRVHAKIKSIDTSAAKALLAAATAPAAATPPALVNSVRRVRPEDCSFFPSG